jgi:uncharacterized protein (TIGR00251 family)
MSQSWCSAIAGGVRIAVHVMPNAKKSEVSGLQGDAIKIRLQAPALEGRANEALIRFLAEALNLPRSAISITHGQTNKRKLLALTGKLLSVEQVQTALLPPPE